MLWEAIPSRRECARCPSLPGRGPWGRARPWQTPASVSQRGRHRGQKVLATFVHQLSNTYWVPVWPWGGRRSGLGNRTPASQDNPELRDSAEEMVEKRGPGRSGAIGLRRVRRRWASCRKEVCARLGCGRVAAYSEGPHSPDAQGEEAGREGRRR